MRLPSRTRGVVLGLATLILSPILAITLVSASQPLAPRPTTPVAAAERVARVQVRAAPYAVAYLLETAPPATPPPTAAPTPAPTAVPTAAPKPRVAPAAPRPPVVPAASPNSIVGIIEAAAARWGVSGSWMVKIATCESGLRPTAYNPSGPYIGLFQFLPSTFSHNGGTNIYDPADQANIAAKMLAHGQAHQWSCA